MNELPTFSSLLASDSNCDRHECPPVNCGKDFVAAALPGECCEKCVPWEYASSLGIRYPHPQPPSSFDQRRISSLNAYPTGEQRVDVYIFGPESGAKVSPGQSIYFDCEIVSPFHHYAQPRWTRTSNQVHFVFVFISAETSLSLFSHCRTRCRPFLSREVGN